MLAEKNNNENDIHETHSEHKHYDESQVSERENFYINFKENKQVFSPKVLHY